MIGTCGHETSPQRSRESGRRTVWMMRSAKFHSWNSRWNWNCWWLANKWFLFFSCLTSIHQGVIGNPKRLLYCNYLYKRYCKNIHMLHTYYLSWSPFLIAGSHFSLIFQSDLNESHLSPLLSSYRLIVVNPSKSKGKNSPFIQEILNVYLSMSITLYNSFVPSTTIVNTNAM